MDGRLKHKLRVIAQEKDVPVEVMYKYYHMEQFAKRVAKSIYKENIIKGGFLISHLSSDYFRSTKDIDATIRHYNLSKKN